MAMTIVYVREEQPQSWEKAIFLTGPTPVTNDVASWRKEALQLLQQKGYDGVVFVPENRPDTQGNVLHEIDYAHLVEWEERCLHLADAIVVWVPRDRETLPGLTTNDEWGVWKDSGKVVFGAPEHAWKTRYLRYYADKLGVPSSTTLAGTITRALEQLGDGALRTGGEREVPLLVWRTPHFTQWYGNLKAAGNVLEHARVVWTFRVGPNRNFVFFWALHAEVFITAEQRSKTNEVVIARPDIATIVLYQKAATIDDSIIVLIREFRTPVSNKTGYVWELPGGSSFTPVDEPRTLASHESFEETGLQIDPARFSYHGARQLVATQSAHKVHVFAAQITDEEVAWLRAQAGIAHGVAEDTEQTYVEIMSLRDILTGDLVDWSMMGMLLSVVR